MYSLYFCKHNTTNRYKTYYGRGGKSFFTHANDKKNGLSHTIFTLPNKLKGMIKLIHATLYFFLMYSSRNICFSLYKNGPRFFIIVGTKNFGTKKWIFIFMVQKYSIFLLYRSHSTWCQIHPRFSPTKKNVQVFFQNTIAFFTLNKRDWNSKRYKY